MRRNPNELMYVYLRIPTLAILLNNLIDDVNTRFALILAGNTGEPFIGRDDVLRMYKFPIATQDDIDFINLRGWRSLCTAVWLSNNPSHMAERAAWVEQQVNNERPRGGGMEGG